MTRLNAKARSAEGRHGSTFLSEHKGNTSQAVAGEQAAPISALLSDAVAVDPPRERDCSLRADDCSDAGGGTASARGWNQMLPAEHRSPRSREMCSVDENGRVTDAGGNGRRSILSAISMSKAT